MLRSAVEFGFHSIHGCNIKFSKYGLLAERIYPSDTFNGGIAYGAKVLSGTTEFEVEITSCKTNWSGTVKLRVMQCKAGSKIEHSDIPQYSLDVKFYCMWSSHRVFNKLVGYSGPIEREYSSTRLENLHEGNRLGLRVSYDGVLTFFVNGKSQGIAAQDVYQEGYDLYPVVDVYGRCTAVRITRAGTYIFQLPLLKTCDARLLESYTIWFSGSLPHCKIRNRMGIF